MTFQKGEMVLERTLSSKEVDSSIQRHSYNVKTVVLCATVCVCVGGGGEGQITAWYGPWSLVT